MLFHEIASALLISKSAITRAADCLEEQRLIVRRPDPNDRRGVLFEITARGMKFLKELEG